MKNNKWESFAGGTIAFDTNMELSDGKHRMLALAELDDDCAITFIAIIEAERSIYTDNGKKRTTGENAIINNYFDEEESNVFDDKIMRVLNTLCGLTANVPIDRKMEYVKNSIDNSKDIIVEFKKALPEIHTRSIINRIPIYAALLNQFALGNITSTDVTHIATVFNECMPIDERDASLMKLIYHCAKHKYSSGYLANIFFLLTTTAINDYVKGIKGNLRFPQKSTKLKMPEIYNFDMVNGDNIVEVEITSCVKIPKKKRA